MYQPAHIDGRTVVVLRRKGLRYTIMENGTLAFDGEELSLVFGGNRRLFTDAEIALLKLVDPGNRILQCKGFDFFSIS